MEKKIKYKKFNEGKERKNKLENEEVERKLCVGG